MGEAGGLPWGIRAMGGENSMSFEPQVWLQNWLQRETAGEQSLVY